MDRDGSLTNPGRQVALWLEGKLDRNRNTCQVAGGTVMKSARAGWWCEGANTGFLRNAKEQEQSFGVVDSGDWSRRAEFTTTPLGWVRPSQVV